MVKAIFLGNTDIYLEMHKRLEYVIEIVKVDIRIRVDVGFTKDNLNREKTYISMEEVEKEWLIVDVN